MGRKRPASLYDWQKMFDEIYGERNESRTTSDIWCRLFMEAGDLLKEQRLCGDRAKHLPNAFAWLCAISTRLGVDLTEAFFIKFPGICLYCGEKSCICPPRWKNGKRLDLSDYLKSPQPETLQGIQDMLHSIYGRANALVALTDLGAHFIEELCEATRALREGRKEDLAEELVDAFAWLLACCSRDEVSLGQITWEKYPGYCPYPDCGQETCQCP